MNWFNDIVWWGAILTGCASSVFVSVPENETLKVHVYIQGSSSQNCEISPDSKMHKLFVDWLSKNHSGWHATPASYVPNVLISGSKFNVNFVSKFAIINYDEGQYSHDINPSDFANFRCDSSN